MRRALAFSVVLLLTVGIFGIATGHKRIMPAGCYTEASMTYGGSETIYYPHAQEHSIDGTEVTCP